MNSYGISIDIVSADEIDSDDLIRRVENLLEERFASCNLAYEVKRSDPLGKLDEIIRKEYSPIVPAYPGVPPCPGYPFPPTIQPCTVGDNPISPGQVPCGPIGDAQAKVTLDTDTCPYSVNKGNIAGPATEDK